MKLITYFVLFFFFSTAGLCAYPQDVAWQLTASANTYPLPENLSAYQIGAEHGCASGLADAGISGSFSREKNYARYHTDHSYRAGWEAGWAWCHNEGVHNTSAVKEKFPKP